jgi:hypothetical protein
MKPKLRNKPYFGLPKPNEFYTGSEVLSRQNIEDGTKVTFNPESEYHVVANYEYDEPCYMYLIETPKRGSLNPNYREEKENYDAAYRAYQLDLRKWNTERKKYEALLSEETKLAELAQLKLLQEKYADEL